MALWVLLAPQAAVPQTSEYQLGKAVLARQMVMVDLQTDYWTLLAVANGKNEDFQHAAETASRMPEMLAEFVALLEPGTARGEAPGSRARPEIWSEVEAFAAVGEEFGSQAVALATAADSGGRGAFAAAFETFTAACTACHGLRPSSGGRFRYGKDE